MSVPCTPSHPPFYRERSVWISEHDDQGRPADPRFVEAAYSLAGTLLQYRRNELRDESRAMQLLEEAVHSASNSEHRAPVTNFSAYLVRRYTTLVDTVLQREQRIQYKEPQALAETYSIEDDVERLENDLYLTKIMSFMDEETRRLCVRILHGYSVAEIARELGVTANSLHLKFRKGCKKAVERLEAGEPPLR